MGYSRESIGRSLKFFIKKKDFIKFHFLEKNLLKNVIFVEKNFRTKRKLNHMIVQSCIKKKISYLQVKENAGFKELLKSRREKVIFQNYFQVEIDFEGKEVDQIESLTKLKNFTQNEQLISPTNNLFVFVLYGVDLLNGPNQLKLLQSMKYINNSSFFLGTAMSIKKIRQEFKDIFFFSSASDFIKIKKKSPLKFNFISRKQTFWNIANFYGRKRTFKMAPNYVLRKIFMTSFRFFQIVIFEKKKFFFKFLDCFIQFSLFKKFLKNFIRFNFAKKFCVFNRWNNVVFLNLIEIYLSFSKFYLVSLGI